MKILLVLAALALAGHARVVEPQDSYEEGDRFIYFPDGDGNLHLVDLWEVDENAVNDNTRNNEVRFWLYTRANPTEYQELTDATSILQSNFDASKETKFIIHGWRSNGHSSINTMVTEAFLTVGDVNVVVVDWGVWADALYVTSTNRVTRVGSRTASFIRVLIDLGLAYSKIHLVGFSLGAHAVGYCGRELGGQVQRITGLDPAGPLWSSRWSDKMRPTDGVYVEAIHTNAGNLGIGDSVADVDFYPNGGKSQPGCGNSRGSGMSCDHSRAYYYFTESITNPNFWGVECGSVDEARNSRCGGSGRMTMGGSDLPKSGNGIYHVTTNPTSPFAA